MLRWCKGIGLAWTGFLHAENKETIFHGKYVFIQDPFPPHISLTTVLQTVEKIIPQYLVYNIDVLYVGDFEYFEQRNINAMYDNGALYVSNKQDDEEDMVDDIVHEISHAVEEKYQQRFMEMENWNKNFWEKEKSYMKF